MHKAGVLLCWLLVLSSGLLSRATRDVGAKVWVLLTRCVWLALVWGLGYLCLVLSS